MQKTTLPRGKHRFTDPRTGDAEVVDWATEVVDWATGAAAEAAGATAMNIGRAIAVAATVFIIFVDMVHTSICLVDR
ncbi:hypothetical protein K7711_05195 [Nocardia sp. CA2R105]|uniref:hypothetical protein n=1 Tax=Nocardia coffeae TaxID=2873381 RepID=UPI001CA5F534|nr:hypothetical protein [Nocardia coffeae]MBY8855866.1 hypothetical protein [Nocardia coffeae]